MWPLSRRARLVAATLVLLTVAGSGRAVGPGRLVDRVLEGDGIVDDGNVTLPCPDPYTCRKGETTARGVCRLTPDLRSEGGEIAPCVRFARRVTDAVHWRGPDPGRGSIGNATGPLASSPPAVRGPGGVHERPSGPPGSTGRPVAYGPRGAGGPLRHDDRALPSWLVVATVIAGAAAWPLWILHRRRNRAELLDHEVRRRMVGIVASSPGIGASELADRLDLAINTVLHHGRLLAEVDVVTMERIDGRVTFFPTDDRVRRKAALVALHQPRRARLFDLVLSAPGINVTEAAETLDVRVDTLRYHVDVLDDRGLITCRRRGRRREMSATEVGRDLWSRIDREATD